ncbi:MAG: Abi family protein [Actinobacteria bacterium]|nr:Abi family protein [Actinomycetota bacterium]
MKYAKPYLTFEDQLAKLESRGLAVSDRGEALRILRSVGYYRWSAYVYPFREMLPEDQQTTAHYRREELRQGVTWDCVEKMWVFDQRLRSLAFQAAETIEVGVRTRLAYVLGARNPFGHLSPGCLDATACGRKCSSTQTVFEAWEVSYRKQQSEAASEEYVKHHLLTYGESEIPVWIAVEFLSFGSILRLLSLMKREDQNAIARALGVSSGAGLHAFLMTIHHVRNIAAHHGRLWNRQLGTSLRRFYVQEVGPDLGHLSERVVQPKVYSALAVMAYLVRNLDPSSNWPRSLATHVKKFPIVPYLSAEDEMGFPTGWSVLPVWSDAPRGVGFSFPPRT